MIEFYDFLNEGYTGESAHLVLEPINHEEWSVPKADPNKALQDRATYEVDPKERYRIVKTNHRDLKDMDKSQPLYTTAVTKRTVKGYPMEIANKYTVYVRLPKK